MTIRLMTPQDGSEYQRLRLLALNKSPEAFLSIFEIENLKPDFVFCTELEYSHLPPYFGYYGVFDQERLIAFCQLNQSHLAKQEHVAFLYNFFVAPNYQGQGIGTLLFKHICDHLKALSTLERIFVSCSATNTVALTFYTDLGFQRYGVRPSSIKWQDRYDDEIELVKVL